MMEAGQEGSIAPGQNGNKIRSGEWYLRQHPSITHSSQCKAWSHRIRYRPCSELSFCSKKPYFTECRDTARKTSPGCLPVLARRNLSPFPAIRLTGEAGCGVSAALPAHRRESCTENLDLILLIVFLSDILKSGLLMPALCYCKFLLPHPFSLFQGLSVCMCAGGVTKGLTAGSVASACGRLT